MSEESVIQISLPPWCSGEEARLIMRGLGMEAHMREWVVDHYEMWVRKRHKPLDAVDKKQFFETLMEVGARWP